MIWIHFVWMCIFFNLQKYSDSCGQGLRSITNNWTGHASYYLLIISILSSGIHTLFPIGICFGIHLKMNNYKTKNYDAKSNISNSSPGNVGNCLLESPSLKISQGGMPPDPQPWSWCLQHIAFTENFGNGVAFSLREIFQNSHKWAYLQSTETQHLLYKSTSWTSSSSTSKCYQNPGK